VTGAVMVQCNLNAPRATLYWVHTMIHEPNGSRAR
jgi:hypothetical protein